MNLRRASLVLFLGVSLFGCRSANPDVNAPLHLVVLHTNDIHGQAVPREATWISRAKPPKIGGLARLAGEVHRLASIEAAAGAMVLVVDGGDWYQGTPEGLVDGGKAFVNLLPLVGYDAMVLGNHEFDHGLEHLVDLVTESGVPVILANVRDPSTGNRVDWALPWRIVEWQRGKASLRVALVGLLTPDTPTITHADARGLMFVDPAVELAQVLNELSALDSSIDLVVPVTHLGVTGDRELAQAFPELALIVGGHSHTTLPRGVREGNTLIVQSGSRATALGRVDLMLDPKTFDTLSSNARLIDLSKNAKRTDQSIERRVAQLTALGAAEMDIVVGKLTEDLMRSRGLKSGSAGNWITDVMRTRLGSDVAIQNRGGIRSNLLAGELTRRDLFEMLPFGNTLVELELSGAELVELCRRVVGDEDHSGIEFSGMRILYKGAWPDGQLAGVEVGGLPVDAGTTYKVATNSFLAGGGDGYFSDSLLGGEKSDTGLILRDLIEDALFQGAGECVDKANRFVVKP